MHMRKGSIGEGRQKDTSDLYLRPDCVTWPHKGKEAGN